MYIYVYIFYFLFYAYIYMYIYIYGGVDFVHLLILPARVAFSNARPLQIFPKLGLPSGVLTFFVVIR